MYWKVESSESEKKLWFFQGDFQRLDLIDETLTNLNACLSDEMLRTQQLYVGLSARTFVQQLKQRALILFKLLLLEKTVIWQGRIWLWQTINLPKANLSKLQPSRLKTGFALPVPGGWSQQFSTYPTVPSSWDAGKWFGWGFMCCAHWHAPFPKSRSFPYVSPTPH